MENFLSNSLSQIFEVMSYFSSEFFCIIGIIINISLFLFLKRKYGLKRLSNLITSCVCIINLLVLGGIYLKNSVLFGTVEFNVMNNVFIITNENILLKALMNLFVFLFISMTYKITNKIHYKVPIVNAYLLGVLLVGGILVQVNNFIIIFLLLDLLIALVYKYASSMRIRIKSTFSKTFIMLGFISSALFFLLYFLTNFTANNLLQSNILKVCMTIAILLKIGLFPIYNYQITRGCRANIPYAILLFSFVPLVGVIAFGKMAEYIVAPDEVYQIPILAFACLTIISLSLFAVKQKNIIKFCANLSYLIAIICIMYIVYFPQNCNISIALISGFEFCMLAFYSTVCIIRLNTNSEMISTDSYKGLFINNKYLSSISALTLLFLTFTLPSCNLFYILQILKGIYMFDSTGIFIIMVLVFALFTALFKIFNLIKNIYSYNETIKVRYKTGTTFLKAAPVAIVFILVIMLLQELF